MNQEPFGTATAIDPDPPLTVFLASNELAVRWDHRDSFRIALRTPDEPSLWIVAHGARYRRMPQMGFP